MTYVVDYSVLRYCVNECIDDGATFTYNSVSKEVQKLEKKKISKWVIISSVKEQGRVHAKCIVFNEGEMKTEVYENAKEFYLSTGATPVAISG